jgi:hypothetical protein
MQHITRAACTARYATCTMQRGMPCATSAMKHGASGVQHPARYAALARDAHTMRAIGLSRATMRRAQRRQCSYGGQYCARCRVAFQRAAGDRSTHSRCCPYRLWNGQRPDRQNECTGTHAAYPNQRQVVPVRDAGAPKYPWLVPLATLKVGRSHRNGASSYY